MGAHVFYERNFLSRPVRAYIACVWFLSRMKSHMRLEMMISCESLVAYFALKWLFTGMRTFMVL